MSAPVIREYWYVKRRDTGNVVGPAFAHRPVALLGDKVFAVVHVTVRKRERETDRVVVGWVVEYHDGSFGTVLFKDAESAERQMKASVGVRAAHPVCKVWGRS